MNEAIVTVATCTDPITGVHLGLLDILEQRLRLLVQFGLVAELVAHGTRLRQELLLRAREHGCMGWGYRGGEGIADMRASHKRTSWCLSAYSNASSAS